MAGSVKLKVVGGECLFVRVQVTKTETPTAGDFEKVAQVPMKKRKHSEGAKNIPEALAYTNEINGSNGSTESAPVTDEDKQDVMDSES